MDTLDVPDDLPPPYSPNDPLGPLQSTSATSSSSSSGSSSSSQLYHFFRNIDDAYKISLEGKWAAYFAETHSGSFLKPHLIIRAQTACGSQLAHCKYGEQLVTCDVGIFQAPGVKKSIAWDRMQRDTSQRTIMFRFAVEVPVSTSPTPTVRTFVWKRTTDMLLVEEETRLVAAVARNMTCLRGTCAKLEVTTRYGAEFKFMAVATFLAIFDSTLRDLQRHYHESGAERCCDHSWEHPTGYQCGQQRGLVDGGILGWMDGPPTYF